MNDFYQTDFVDVGMICSNINNARIKVVDIYPTFKGVFATGDIKEGDYIFRNWNDGAVLLERSDVTKLPPPYRFIFEKYAIELFEKKHLGPAEDDPIRDPAYFINHSCDPNTWLVSDDDVAARRDIMAGEELTIDYATFWVNSFESSKIDRCLCGTAICRGKVDNNDWWRMKDVYQGHVLSWIQQKIDERNRGI